MRVPPSRIAPTKLPMFYGRTSIMASAAFLLTNDGGGIVTYE